MPAAKPAKRGRPPTHSTRVTVSLRPNILADLSRWSRLRNLTLVEGLVAMIGDCADRDRDAPPAPLPPPPKPVNPGPKRVVHDVPPPAKAKKPAAPKKAETKAAKPKPPASLSVGPAKSAPGSRLKVKK